jgi:ATP citrate (pro-S)-lyase
METARAKNQALKDAGAHVPNNFFEFGNEIKKIYDGLVESGSLVPAPEPETPKIPMDYTWAKRLGLVRKPGMSVTANGSPIVLFIIVYSNIPSDLHCSKLYLFYI